MSPKEALRDGVLSLVDRCDALIAQLVKQRKADGGAQYVSALIRVAEGLCVTGAVNTGSVLLEKAQGWLRQAVPDGPVARLLDSHVLLALGVADAIRGGSCLSGAKAKLRKSFALSKEKRPPGASSFCESENTLKLRAALALAWVHLQQGSAEAALQQSEEVLDAFLPSCGKVQVLSSLIVSAVAYEGCVLYSYADAMACWEEALGIVNAAGAAVDQFFDRRLLDEEIKLCRLRENHKLPRARTVQHVAVPLLKALLPSALCNTSSIPLVLLQKCLIVFEDALGDQKTIGTTPPRVYTGRVHKSPPSAAAPPPAADADKSPAKRSKTPLSKAATHTPRQNGTLQQRPSVESVIPLRAGAKASPYVLPKGGFLGGKRGVRPAVGKQRTPHPPRSAPNARRGGYVGGTPGTGPETPLKYFDPSFQAKPLEREKESLQPQRMSAKKEKERPVVKRKKDRAARTLSVPSPERVARAVECPPAPAEAERALGVMKQGVAGMTFDAMHELLVDAPGWVHVQAGGTAGSRDYSACDVFLGEKLQVEALIESCFVQIRRRHASPGAALRDRKRPLLVNYFLGARMLTLKSKMVDLLRARFARPYEITPATYILVPHGSDERREFLACPRPVIWIAKSSHGSKGLHVKIARDKREIMKHVDGQEKQYRWVVQEYLASPFLIHGRKFDIRTWVLLTPDRSVWVYRRGVCRTSSYQYSGASLGNLDDHLTHLTNHHIQEQGQKFSLFEEGNEMWFHQFDEYLKSLPEPKNYYRDIEPQLNDLTRKMFEAGASSIHTSPDPLQSFQLFGFDFLVDSDMRCWLLEVNGSPAIAEYLKVDMVGDMCELLFRGTRTAAELIERRGARKNDFVRLIKDLP
eukprot:TRINITY_DN16295_c1_g1_i1.p1 TRINITY_DN16295_c1_g1~~TRINITY_DN16295_c1_g1_i1.p1  ORF type:complete len:864 (+),score=351.28 TRINITY_DN16295_c1_g1_i1:106-2697(+)